MKIWSPLHGDMQEVTSKEVSFHSECHLSKAEAKFLVG